MVPGYKIVQISGRWTYAGEVDLLGLAWVRITNAVMIAAWGTGDAEHRGIGALVDGPRPETRLWGMGGSALTVPIGAIEWMLDLDENVWAPLCQATQHTTHEGEWSP